MYNFAVNLKKNVFKKKKVLQKNVLSLSFTRMPLSATIRAFFLKKKERRASITASIVKQPQSQQQQTENNSSKSSTVNSSTKGDSKDGLNFTFKDGRRYHNEAEVAYVLPNDYDGNSPHFFKMK